MVTTMMPSGTWSVVSAVVLGILLLAKLLTSSKYKNLPPGPRGFPIIGSLHLLGKFPVRDLTKLAETYGPLMSMWLGPRLLVVATSPAAAEEILKTQGSNFANRFVTSASNVFLPGDIATMSDSPLRLHLKKILHIQLSTNKQLQLATNMRTEEIAHVMRVIPQDGVTPVPVRSHIEVAVTNIMSRVILKRRFMVVSSGKKHDEQDLEQVSNFRKILMDIAKYAQIINPGDFIPIFKWMDIFGLEKQMREVKERMDAFMSPIISEHIVERKSGSTFTKDMVDVLLDEMEDEKSQFDITNDNVSSTLWNAFTASMSTTTDTIEWAIAECIRNPIVMKKVQEELDTVVGKSRRVEEADVPNLKYLQAVVKENFRLHPVLPLLIPHLNKEPCKVLGYNIPGKTLVFVNVAAIARDPRTWEDPMTFKPERFLDGMPHANIQYEGKNFEVLPFGAGRRQCAGILLASTFIHIIVATFMQSFNWSLPNGLQPKDLDMSADEGVGHVLAHPLIAIPKARLSIS